ncbi:MAG: hypothetical protein ABIT36_12900 [Steroidobacteraceae bacterium]
MRFVAAGALLALSAIAQGAEGTTGKNDSARIGQDSQRLTC